MELVPGRYRTYYDKIGQVLMEGAELLVKPEECLAALRVIDAVGESAERGEVVRLGDS